MDDGSHTLDGLPVQLEAIEGEMTMAIPEEVDVWVGLDVGKGSHFGWVLDNDDNDLFSRPVGNDEAALDTLFDDAGLHGTPGLVIDQPGSIGQLALVVAARRGVPVAYVPGLVMRKAADLYRRSQQPPDRCPGPGRHGKGSSPAGPLA